VKNPGVENQHPLCPHVNAAESRFSEFLDRSQIKRGGCQMAYFHTKNPIWVYFGGMWN
jgi:hypothetical protein